MHLHLNLRPSSQAYLIASRGEWGQLNRQVSRTTPDFSLGGVEKEHVCLIVLLSNIASHLYLNIAAPKHIS